MDQPIYTTPTRYHLRRIAQIVLVAALIAGIKPALALFSQNEEFDGAGTSQEPAPKGDNLSASATTLLEDNAVKLPDFPEVNATVALVKEIGAPAPLAVYGSTVRWPIASLTKLMTAVVALDELGPGAIIPISQEAVDTEGLAGGLRAGERYTVIDLVRIMLTVSSNDATMSLARAYDQKQLTDDVYEQAINKAALFTAAIQRKARAIGMSETYFGDPSGLSVINQSVLTDLDVLVNYVLANHPEIIEITRQKETTVLERVSMTRRTLLNINEFAGRADFIGGKTGFTDASGGNLISILEFKGKQYLIIVLGADDRFGETTKLFNWVKSLASNS